MNMVPTMATLHLALIAFLFVLPVPIFSYRITIESMADFERYGLRSDQGRLIQITNATELPAYYPDSYRRLPGNNFMYIVPDDAGNPATRFDFITTQLRIEGKVLNFFAEYYDESGNSIMYGPWNGGQFFPFYDTPPSQGSRWTVTEGRYQDTNWFPEKLGFSFANDRSSNLVVFRRLEIDIGVQPKIHIKIENPTDLAESGLVCEGGCVFRSVSNASHLPEYFPDDFRTLTLQEGEYIMWAEQNQTDFFRRTYMLKQLDVQFNVRCGVWSEGGFFYSADYYQHGTQFGYGPAYYNDGWADFPWAGAPDGVWRSHTTERYTLSSVVCHMQNNKLGFYSYNDQNRIMAVFKRLEIEIYYKDDGIVTPTTTTTMTPPTTTTSGTTPPPRSTTSGSTTVSTSTTSTAQPSTTPSPWTTSTLPTTTTSSSPPHSRGLGVGQLLLLVMSIYVRLGAL